MKKEENITRYSAEELAQMRAEGKSKTDWARLDALADDAIDCSDIPPLGADFWKNAKLVTPGKERISLHVDQDILQYFKGQGKGYQTRMNAVLRHYVEYAMHERDA